MAATPTERRQSNRFDRADWMGCRLPDGRADITLSSVVLVDYPGDASDSGPEIFRLVERLFVAAVVCFFVGLFAPFAIASADAGSTSCGPGSTSFNGGVCTLSWSDSTHVRIDQPFVAGPSYEYQSIAFQPGDAITINAGGCVQTGGGGDTWKRYVDPSGDQSGPPSGLYFGSVRIPGAIFADNPVQPVNNVPLSETIGHTLIIPALDAPDEFTARIDLRLNYADDIWDDNGYYDHDNGNNDQCAYSNDGGPAWLTVSVQHGVAGPMPALHPERFDVVPNGYDSNLLFKNPVWGWQWNSDPIATAGDPFFDAGLTLECPQFPCTSQITSQDHPGPDIKDWFGDHLCGGNQSGHTNWFDVTYHGIVSWDVWDSGVSGDDDYNMQLHTPVLEGGTPAGVTSNNPDTVKLEFDSDETIDHFDVSNWWANFHSAVQDDRTDLINNMVEGHDAVVIGLMGLDVVHEASSEVHPVHVLAINTADPANVNPVNEGWAIFARNWGNEGECSSQQHFLDGNTFTLDLPRPSSVPSNSTATLAPGNDFYLHGTDVAPKVHNYSKGVQVTFTLPDPANQPFAVGELHLSWSGVPLAARRTNGRHVARRTGPHQARTLGRRLADDTGEPEQLLAGIWNGMTAAQQQTAKMLFATLFPPLPPETTTHVTAQMSSTPPSFPSSVPTVSSAPDPLWAQRIHAQSSSLCAATGGNLPTQPDWCSSLNFAPVTTLNITGGAPGPNGWVITPATATLTGYDASGSGINHTEYRYAGVSDWTTYTGPFTLPDGIFTFEYRSQDNDGNLEETRQRAFKIDTAPPSIAINQPTPTDYTHSSTLTLDYTVDDGPLSGLGAGSGVASTVAKIDGATTLAGHGLASGQTIDPLTELSLGPHTFSIDAVDNVGHAASKSVTFTIVVTPDSIVQDVNQFFAAGAMTGQGREASLLAKLEAARSAWNSGNCTAADNLYQAFINELQAQSGKSVDASAALIMIQDAQYLIAHCGSSLFMATQLTQELSWTPVIQERT
jgi:hypothetical protein